MKPGFLSFLLCLTSTIVFSQNTIGIPAIINYSRHDYHAGSQNWDIRQDNDGILYFANNDGLLTYDGNFWRLYPLPNHTIVRSLAIGPDHRIYVGGQGEIGYFAPGPHGDLSYTSLNKLIPGQDNDFADVWNTIVLQDQTFFRSNRKIFQLDKDRIIVYKSINWDFMGKAGATLIANEYSRGLVKFTNGQWSSCVNPLASSSSHASATAAPPAAPLPPGIQIRSVIAAGKDSFLLTSLAHGLFCWSKDRLTQYETPTLTSISRANINGSCRIDAGKTALITNLGGCFIVNNKGGFIQRLSKKEGLQNNNILSIFLDRNGNIWLGLDNGIDLVTYNNAIKNIFPEPEDRNPGYTSIIYRNSLYLGTSTGVYRSPLDPGSDCSFTKSSFQFIKNTTGQIWTLSQVNGQLWVGHNQGAYRIDKDTAIPFDQTSGFWTFQPFNNFPAVSPSSPMMITGTYNGINFYNYKEGHPSNPNIHAHFESARFVVIDSNRIWIAHPYKGLYKVEFNKEGKPIATGYPDKKHLLSGNHNHLFKIKGRIILTNDKGIYEFDSRLQEFVRSSWFAGFFGAKTQADADALSVDYLKEDPYGNIWFIRDRKLGVVDLSGIPSAVCSNPDRLPDACPTPGIRAGQTTPRIIYFPELNNKVLGGDYENIYIADSNNIFVAAEQGFCHINYQLYKKDKCPLRVLIRSVRTDNPKAPLLFGGYAPATASAIPYNDNSLHFEFSSLLYGQPQNVEYSYRLDHFDRDWSKWSTRPEKDYTNLRPGDYTFQVRCRNSIDNESAPASYSFRVLPPWYETGWAYGGYALLALVLVVGLYRQQEKKFRRRQLVKLLEQRKAYEEEQRQRQYQHQLEIEQSEKEIIRLKNERLNVEIAHKNSELASTAMILVQKGKLLSRIREDLVRLKNNAGIEKESKDYKKIIRVIEGELGNGHEWEQFSAHFDDVHTNYLKTLKERYPDLTTSDLKLCAYLRLNLSSKEIAQLMNISIRGVETGRYRVRKKLEIPNDISLFDFLSTITA
ncbi:MAG TPA: triple tyrosine motif-containing protein [Puia sp.]|nr:triple tyrosine motif-containing protein [Puia sp.]